MSDSTSSRGPTSPRQDGPKSCSTSAEAQGADVAVFFYAGHGIAISGTNYLLPIDAGHQVGDGRQLAPRSISI